MAKKKDFESFTPDDILNAWLDALKEGLGPGRTFGPESRISTVKRRIRCETESGDNWRSRHSMPPRSARRLEWRRTSAPSARSWPMRRRTRS